MKDWMPLWQFTLCLLLGVVLALGALTIIPGNPPQAWRDEIWRDTGYRTYERIGWPPLPGVPSSWGVNPAR